MKISEVCVGGYYLANVSKRKVPILVEAIDWQTKKLRCRNLVTGYPVKCTGRRLLKKLTYEEAMKILGFYSDAKKE